MRSRLRSQSPCTGQALVEWMASVFILLLFAIGILAVGQIVSEAVAVREAATQAALAAARAPSEVDAQRAAQLSAQEAMAGRGIEDFHLDLNTGGFQRGGTLTVSASGYVSLRGFPVVSQVLGQRVPLSWQAHALIEPYRSRVQP